jgi:hypothetical protein
MSSWLRPAVSKEVLTGRNTAFAALALLRCRGRIARMLETIAEPRRKQAAVAVAELDRIDDTDLKRLLVELIRREDAELRDAAMRALGSESTQAPRVVLRWLVRGAAR